MSGNLSYAPRNMKDKIIHLEEMPSWLKLLDFIYQLKSHIFLPVGIRNHWLHPMQRINNLQLYPRFALDFI